MNMKYLKQINILTNKYRLEALKHVGVFFIILLGFHFFYNIFLRPLVDVEPYNILWFSLQKLLYTHSTWVLENIIGYDFLRDGFLITFPGRGFILVDETCSATKWLLHFLVLMLIFPGPWKHKSWFIPMGLILVHAISVSRIVGLSMVYVNIPQYWDFFHDYVFRPFFYLMLFLVWVYWVEVFLDKPKTTGKRFL